MRLLFFLAFVLFVCLTSIATAVVPFSITDIHQGQFTDLQAVECEILPFVFPLSGFFLASIQTLVHNMLYSQVVLILMYLFIDIL